MSEQTFIIQTDTPEQKNAIDEAITSIDANGAIKHKAVLEDTQKRYPHLFNR